MDICEGNLTFHNFITKYSSSELPSGVKSRLFLFSKVLTKADAAIIINKRPKKYDKLYSTLNDLILFGGMHVIMHILYRLRWLKIWIFRL